MFDFFLFPFRILNSANSVTFLFDFRKIASNAHSTGNLLIKPKTTTEYIFNLRFGFGSGYNSCWNTSSFYFSIFSPTTFGMPSMHDGHCSKCNASTKRITIIIMKKIEFQFLLAFGFISSGFIRPSYCLVSHVFFVLFFVHLLYILLPKRQDGKWKHILIKFMHSNIQNEKRCWRCMPNTRVG